MTIRIITINGQKLITGLYWQNLSDTAHPRKEIVQIGREADADMVCVPAVKNPIQAGYVTKAELAGVTGVRSLAGGLAESQTGSWLGFFKLPDDSDQYYYIAVQNDHILASSDIVGDLEEIRTTFEQTLSVGGWQYVTVPEEFTYPGATVTHLTLAEMLTKRGPKLKSLEFKFEDLPIRKIIYGISAAAVIGGGWYGYSSWQEEQERVRQEEARKLFEQERARKAAEQAVIPPWINAIAVEQFLMACDNHWHTVDYSVSGWEITKWDCEANQSISSYEKAPMASALELMKSAPAAAISSDGRKASIVTLIKTAATGSRPAVRGMTAKAAIMDFAESHIMNLSIAPVPLPQPLPGKDAPPPPPWSIEKFSLDSSYPVFSLSELARIPGLIVKHIAADNAKGVWKWHIDGEIYVAK